MIEAMKLALEALIIVRFCVPPAQRKTVNEAIKALEEALAKQEQGEPMAVVTGMYGGRFVVEPTNPAMVLPVNMALYTHPQPRKPLTDEQIDAYLESEWTGYSSYHDCFKEIVRWTEAKHDIKE